MAELDGRSARWDTHRAQRRVELARGARRAIHRHGPDVSMEDIARHAGTSKSIVYRYFTDKAGLQAAVAELVAVDVRRLLAKAADDAATPTEALRSMVRVYLDTIQASPNVYLFVMQTGDGPGGETATAFIASVIEMVTGPVTRQMGDSGLSSTEIEAWSAGAVSFVRGIGEWWMSHRAEPDTPGVEDLTYMVARWLWSGPVPQEMGSASVRKAVTASAATE